MQIEVMKLLDWNDVNSEMLLTLKWKKVKGKRLGSPIYGPGKVTRGALVSGKQNETLGIKCRKRDKRNEALETRCQQRREQSGPGAGEGENAPRYAQ